MKKEKILHLIGALLIMLIILAIIFFSWALSPKAGGYISVAICLLALGLLIYKIVIQDN